MPPDPSRMMWSAVRSACAAMVSAGFTAAEVGRKLASTTKRFGWSWLRQKASTTLVAGSVPIRAVPHWCDGVRRSKGFESTSGKPARRSTRLELRHQRLVRLPVRAAPVEDDALALERDPAVRIGQVLAHRVEVDRVAARASPRPAPGTPPAAARIGARDLAEKLHVAERRAVRAAGQVEVVDEEGLLVDRGVAAEGAHRQHRRAVVVHEVAPDLVGAVGEPRAQQQHRRVDRAGAEDDEARRESRFVSPPCRYSTAVTARPASASSRVDERAGLQRHVRMRERRGDADALGVALGAGGVGEGVPRRRGALQPARRGRARGAATRASRRPRFSRARKVGDARLVGHRRKGVAAGVPRLGRVLRRRRRARGRAPRRADTRARSRRR